MSKNYIRELRKKAGLTQEQLADKILPPCRRLQIANLENGKRRLTQEWMGKISVALNCGQADLLGVSGVRIVPVWGEVPAGEPLHIPEPHESVVPMTTIEYPTKNSQVFALQVRANSHSMNMIAPAGSFVLIDPTRTDPQDLDGKYIIANLSGECTFKRFGLNPLRLEAYSNDPSHMTRYLTEDDQLIIVGEVVGQFNDLRG